MPDVLSQMPAQSAPQPVTLARADVQRLVKELPADLKARLLVSVLEQKKAGGHAYDTMLDRIASRHGVQKSGLKRAILAEFLAEVKPVPPLAIKATANSTPGTGQLSTPASPKATPPQPVQKEHPRVAAQHLAGMDRQRAVTALRSMTTPMARATARALRDIETRHQHLPTQAREIIGSAHQ